MSENQALDAIKKVQSQSLASEYGGKMSNQFVAELKGSTLFQFDWSELLSAAPTALSLMGACYIAAAQPKAEQISLEKSMPTSGFKHLTNRRAPTLRACLVDICNVGGRAAFVTASANMDALQIRSQRICAERIDLIFKRLGPCTRDADALEDFNDALQDFSKEAKQCAQLATETREAFSKWGRMVGELHAVTEQQQGVTSIDREGLSIEEKTADVEKKFAAQAVNDVKDQVAQATKGLENAEKRLDTAIANVPSPWESCIQGAVAGFTQAIPGIVSAALPAVMASINPIGAIGGQLKGALSGAINDAVSGAVGTHGANGTAAGGVPPAAANLADPAYAAATGSQDLVNHFYEYLGGDKGPIDWTKFDEGKENAGLSYISATLTGTKNNASHGDASEANRKFQEALDKLIAVTGQIREYKKGQTDLNAKPVADSELQQWKDGVKAGRTGILALAATANSFGSNAVPQAFGKVAPGQSAGASSANAAANTALQGVQMAQTAVDNAQSNYDAAVARQAKTAAAMAGIEAKLARLRAEGQTLDSIKSILRDCISVLVDLAIQVGKLEKFFTMLTTVIDNIILVRADTFTNEMGKAGRRALANGAIKIDEIAKQTIYTSTLQLKGYFSLLGDIASMYCTIDRRYIIPGTELCMKLSKGAASNDPMEQLQEELGKYTEESAKAVAELVKQKQDEVLNGLKDRAKRAAETTMLIENTAKQQGLVIDQSAKQAIEAGGAVAKETAKEIIAAKPSETSENVDANDL